MFRQLTGSVNKIIVKPRNAAAVGRKTILNPHVAAAANIYTSDFPDVKFRVRLNLPFVMPKTSGNAPTLLLIGPLSNSLHNHYLNPKKQYYANLVSSSSDNPRRLWRNINKLLHRKSTSPLPTSTSASALADSLASFVTDNNLRLSLANSSTSASPHSPSSPITPP